MNNRFLQVHYLTSYPAALLNRDDVGFAKRISFGGASRTRISSQCQKRHWRTFQGEHALAEVGVPPSVRSRATFERCLLVPLIDDGVDEALATAVVEEFMAAVLGQSAKAKKAKADADKDGAPPTLRTGQITVLGRPEVDFLLGAARELCSEVKKPQDVGKAVKEKFSREGKANLQSLRHASGLGAALFGRMVTSDILARGDAAVHVAHAFTVHVEETESDYFSAVDELLSEAEHELGSGHIGNVELTSGLYYGYVAIDVPLLVSNLEGCDAGEWQSADRALAAEVIQRLVRLIATVSPGAKLGSTAPHAYAQCLLAEVGSSQPRTLANAFLRPVSPRPSLLENAYEAMARHISELDVMYGRTTERSLAGIGGADALKDSCGAPTSIASVAEWAAAQVKSS